MAHSIEVHWTAPTMEEAQTIARQAIANQCAACAQIYPQITSVYSWQGKVEEGNEIKVVFKTVAAKFTPLKELILKNCSYKVPEITAVPIIEGHMPYLDWMNEVLK